MTTRNKAMEAVKQIREGRGDAVAWREALDILDSFIDQEPETPDAEVWEEIDNLILVLSKQDEEEYSVYRGRNSCKWGMEKPGHDRAQAVISGVSGLTEFRDKLREMTAKQAEGPTTEAELKLEEAEAVIAERDETIRQWNTDVAELCAVEWRQRCSNSPDVIYGVQKIDKKFAMYRRNSGSDKRSHFGCPGTDFWFTTEFESARALRKYAKGCGWKEVK